MKKLYNDYGTYLKKRYGTKVYRIGLDAGFACPGRCAYCNDSGSRASYAVPGTSVTCQLRSRIEFLKNTERAEKFIAYFQAFTNTLAPVKKLKTVYDEVLPFADIVGISIGTRPDAVDKDKIGLISSYTDKYEVWIEYGLQSIHDKTLERLNGGHDFSKFIAAVETTKGSGIKICAHIILGLPGETRAEMLATARRLGELGIDGVKIHLFHILRGSEMEKLYAQGKVAVMDQNKYIETVCDFLENLPADMIIQRLTGEGPRSMHIAPAWALDKTRVINSICQALENRGSRQGIRYGRNP